MVFPLLYELTHTNDTRCRSDSRIRRLYIITMIEHFRDNNHCVGYKYPTYACFSDGLWKCVDAVGWVRPQAVTRQSLKQSVLVMLGLRCASTQPTLACLVNLLRTYISNDGNIFFFHISNNIIRIYIKLQFI